MNFPMKKGVEFLGKLTTNKFGGLCAMGTVNVTL
jgi:hypothetical protein